RSEPAVSKIPDFFEQANPVLAHQLPDARFLPAALFHRRGEVGVVLDLAHAGGVDDVAELGELARVALVARDPLEELAPVALGEAGAEADLLFAADVDDVLHRPDVAVERGRGAALHAPRL